MHNTTGCEGCRTGEAFPVDFTTLGVMAAVLLAGAGLFLVAPARRAEPRVA
jgi:hypothetical protein